MIPAGEKNRLQGTGALIGGIAWLGWRLEPRFGLSRAGLPASLALSVPSQCAVTGLAAADFARNGRLDLDGCIRA